MKTKLLRRLRKETLTECPCEELQAYAEYVGWSYNKTRRRIQAKKRDYILRRVAELKRRRK
jgi:hypothetical protein